ncbi:MAG: hypothetical protein IIC23_03420 [Chloroflexi bacterium]|nr:hypothetical protein [Chloroflexota bacterium]MCH9038421.1 hypothetical protein [Chloroflexota bacterium]
MPVMRAGVFPLVTLLFVAVACSPQPQPQTRTQTQATRLVETAEPIVASCETDQEPRDLESISASLGYAFEPTYVPDGFRHSGSSLDRRRRANLVYSNGQATMLIAYPVQFFREGSPTMVDLGLIQPADAVSDVSIGERGGHMLRGGWSELTILAGPGISPADARWDYQRSVTLFFDCETAESEVVGVAVQSIPGGTGDLISDADLIKVASSMLRARSSTR